MQCHASPIYTLARNPSFFKNFLTVGDWNARIWSEDCKESAIIWTKYCSVELTDGCWSPTKCSLFYLSRTDGSVEAWDLLQQQSEPILTIKVWIYFRMNQCRERKLFRQEEKENCTKSFHLLRFFREKFYFDKCFPFFHHHRLLFSPSW